jgi:hypothetical protein
MAEKIDKIREEYGVEYWIVDQQAVGDVARVVAEFD